MIYLACPYNDPNPVMRRWRVNVATRAATICHDRGIPVFSPLTHGFHFGKSGLVRQPWAYWSKIDLPILTNACTHIAVIKLKGWENSEGVTAERAAAGERGIKQLWISRCSSCGKSLVDHSPFGAMDMGICLNPKPDIRSLLDAALDSRLYFDLPLAEELA